MTTDNFKILFIEGKNRKNKKNQSPLFCRLTLNGNRKQLSTGINIESEHWDTKNQVILKSHKSAILYNSQLDKIKSKISSIYMILQLQENPFSIEDIHGKYLGKELKKSEFILSYYKQYLSKIEKLVGREIKDNTYSKFVYVGNHLEAFLKWKYKKTDYPLKELSLQFLSDFDYYLKTEKKQGQITVNKTIQRLRTPIKQAISEGYLDRDPFILHKSKTVRKTVIFLTTEELKTLEKAVLQQKRLSTIQDLFIFCCYTGLAYNEMTNLEKQNIQIGFDNINWIQMKREKTQRLISIPILPKYNVETGELVNSYVDLVSAANAVNANKRSISNVCLHTNKTCKGYNWSYSSTIESKSISDLRRKTVNQISLDGEIVACYESASEASRKSGLSKTCIARCCRGEREQSGGFLWKYS
ncbi:site-specific integrase [Flavobacterium franklandianum]|uniref:phage integrase SAM-like domain-containing protein n=1 Tax=Flavobacterium franklandianum TaxID=2594430 RepID=UPI001179DBE0|nr:phage integrase SAM-like domain-containing protein [Flavobacterium franklandianum]TRX24506.1 site-specific integrase [Flavobacterium franklandianum]